MRVTIEENGHKTIMEGRKTVIENVERDCIKIRVITYIKNGKIIEKTDRHFDSNRNTPYWKTERGNEVRENWIERDETGYCIHQKQSDGTEYRNVKADDKNPL